MKAEGFHFKIAIYRWIFKLSSHSWLKITFKVEITFKAEINLSYQIVLEAGHLLVLLFHCQERSFQFWKTRITQWRPAYPDSLFLAKHAWSPTNQISFAILNLFFLLINAFYNFDFKVRLVMSAESDWRK